MSQQYDCPSRSQWEECSHCGKLCEPYTFSGNDDMGNCFVTYGDDGRGAHRPTYFWGSQSFCSNPCFWSWYQQQTFLASC